VTRIKEAWIVGAVRTPIGRHGGALGTVRPDELGALAAGLSENGAEVLLEAGPREVGEAQIT
jgi:acetyl-CoA acetyltransferase